MLYKCAFYCLFFFFISLTFTRAEEFEQLVKYSSDSPSDDTVLKFLLSEKLPFLVRHRRDVKLPETSDTKPTASVNSNASNTTASSNTTSSLKTTSSRPNFSNEVTSTTPYVSSTNTPTLENKKEPLTTANNSPLVSSISEVTDAVTSTNSEAQINDTTTEVTPSPSTQKTSTTSRPTTASPTEPGPTTTAYFNTSTIRDHHKYYITDIHNDPALTKSLEEMFDRAFAPGKSNRHHYLLRSMNHAVKFKTSFTFPFYGHDQNRITLGTGGFVYLSDFLHPYLMHSQYAAPLMAPLHTYKDHSDIRYVDDGNAFWVLWHNLYINKKEDAGSFSFQMVIFKNGTIVFSYYKLPILPKDMKDIKPDVRIGLSDAYYWDVSIPWSNMRMRKIIRYDTLDLPLDKIREKTVVIFTPMPTCQQQDTCESCLAGRTNFSCSWCVSLGRCSSGIDRHRQEWEQYSCHKLGMVDGKCPLKVPVSRVVAISIVLLLCVALAAAAVLWCRYAYLNPSSPSGIWLLEHRPSVLKAKFSRVMFWKRYDPAGDRYQVSFASTETFA